MSAFWRLYRAETIKWRRDWAFLTAVLAPFIQVGFLFLIVWFSEERANIFEAGFMSWYKVNFLAWNFLIMPVSTAMVASLSWDLEDKAKSWSHLLAMPAPRGAHFLAKLASQFSMALVSQALLALLLLVGGLLLRAYLPVLRMGPLLPTLLLHFMLFTLSASLPVVVLHAWMPTRLPSLGANLGIALVGTWLGLHFRAAEKLIGFLPWGLAVQIIDISIHAKLPADWVYWASALGALAMVTLGLLDFRRSARLLDR